MSVTVIALQCALVHVLQAKVLFMQGMQAEQDGDLYGGNYTHVILATLFVTFCLAATLLLLPLLNCLWKFSH